MTSESSCTTPLVSVVIATYSGELASYLQGALESLINQTNRPAEIVVVADGPIPFDQETVLDQAVETSPVPIRIVRLATNVGRGNARNCGIAACTSEYVALMDSDDLCVRNRLQVQAEFIRNNPHVDIVASWTQEFDENNPSEKRIKYTPTTHEEIVKALRWSNCVANPTIVFRKTAWDAVGRMPDFRQMNEDYLFFLRLCSAGFRFACIPEVLLYVRIDERQKQRRRGWGILKEDLRFRWNSYREGHLSLSTTAVGIIMITAKRAAPSVLQGYLQRGWRLFGRIMYSSK